MGPARNSFTQARQLNAHCHDATLALVRLSGAGPWSRIRGWCRRLFSQ
jgi:hypothetical protein